MSQGLAGQLGVIKLHNFRESLAKSHAQADAPWWEEVYRKAFHNFAGMVCVRDDGWAQRGGIDRVITLTSGRTVTVDEKIREEDWPDILWEYLSSVESGTPGWCAKDLACDFIAYAFVPSQRCYLLPTLQMRRAWRENHKDWVRKGRERRGGFRIVDAVNRGYSTRSVAVPISVTMDAIRDAMVVDWSVPTQAVEQESDNERWLREYQGAC